MIVIRQGYPSSYPCPTPQSCPISVLFLSYSCPILSYPILSQPSYPPLSKARSVKDFFTQFQYTPHSTTSLVVPSLVPSRSRHPREKFYLSEEGREKRLRREARANHEGNNQKTFIRTFFFPKIFIFDDDYYDSFASFVSFRYQQQ